MGAKCIRQTGVVTEAGRLVIRPVLIHRCRGGIYLAVLAATVVATLLGLSGLAVVRHLSVSARNDDAAASASRASADFKSVLDYMSEGFGANWRTTHTNNAWYQFPLSPDNRVTYKFVDEADGDLDDHPYDPLRFHIAGQSRSTKRVYSVLINTPKPEQLLYNGGFDRGIAGWTCWDRAFLDVETNDTRTAWAARISQRESWWIGPNQEIATDKIENGQTYEAYAWVRSPGGTQNFKVTFEITSSGDGTRYLSSPSQAVGNSWSRIGGLATISWSGTLTRLRYYVETPYSTDDFVIDDCTMNRSETLQTTHPIPGTWRKETLD